MEPQEAIKLDEIARAVQELRQVHHGLRHPYTRGCAECVYLRWLRDNGF